MWVKKNSSEGSLFVRREQGRRSQLPPAAENGGERTLTHTLFNILDLILSMDLVTSRRPTNGNASSETKRNKKPAISHKLATTDGTICYWGFI